MSSDSDDDQLKAKKAKSSGMRARRGFSKKNIGLTESLLSKEAIPTSSAIYSSCVSKCFNNIKSHELEEEMQHAITDTTDDVEDDLLSRCSKMTPPKLSQRDPILYLSDDDEENENCQNLQNTPSNNNNAKRSLSPPPPPQFNARGRHRGGGKKKKNLLNAVNNLTKNLSDAQGQLKASQQFQSPEPDVYVIDDSEVTVRIDHMGQIQRYSLDPDEPFSTIITQVAARENVPEKCVMLVHNDKTLRPTDSPMSVKLHTADIITCHINQNAEDSFNDSLSFDHEDANMIELVVQTRGSKHKELIKAHRMKPLSILMKDYAGRVKKAQSGLQFLFDGEVVGNNETPAMLDMEDGDILDVNEIG